MQSPALAMETSTGRKSLIKFFQRVFNGDYRGMKPTRPLFCAKNRCFVEFLHWFGRFLFEKDPYPLPPARHTPATTGSWRPC